MHKIQQVLNYNPLCLLQLCMSLYYYPFIKPNFNPLSNSRSSANFSFQFIASYVWYSLENLAGDLLMGVKFL